MVAFEAAKMCWELRSDVQIAYFLKEVFAEMITMPGFVPEDLKKQFAKPVSETLVDFAFASGRTENMSLRMMQYQREK